MTALRLSLCSVLLLVGCGGSTVNTTLQASWTFASGDCTSNAVTTVRVFWSAADAGQQQVDFPCAQSSGTLGEVSPSGGSYAIRAEGLDAAGIARVVHLGTTLNISKGAPTRPVELTLRPKSANVQVTWSGCPPGVILPYTIGLYVPAATAGGTLGMKQTETQQSCATRAATLMNVPPGTWTVDLDSRAVQPAIKARKDVTMTAGQDATVDFQL